MKRFSPACFTALALTILFAEPGVAGDGRVTPRLREHFDLTRLDSKGGGTGYFGLSNTANLWYERPYEWAVGLAFNPVLSGGSEQIGASAAAFPDEFRLWSFGIEWQQFLYAEPERYGLFFRAGAYGNLLELDTGRTLTGKSGENLAGGSYYLGLGWEQKIWRIGIAPEIAWRQVFLESGVRLDQFSPSIALRLYFINEWLEGGLRETKDAAQEAR